MEIESFFKAKKIAVIGASRYKGKVGYEIFRNLIKGNKDVFPINPKAKKICGRKVYSSVLEVNENIELAIIAVPAKVVPKVLMECGKKKIKNVIIISSGFSEIGNKKLEDELKKIAEAYKIRIIGPNCLGVINPYENLNATFFKKMPKKGKIAFISQSGALGVAILDWAIQNNVGFSLFVSVGNSLDISFPELIKYLNKDKKTKAICLYIEGLKDGRKFMEAVSKKPVIVLKGGLTKSGEIAAKTHTAALISDAGIYRGAFKQCGTIQVENLYQLFEIAKYFVYGKFLSGNKGLIITNAGGVGVLASDAFERNGLKIAKIPESVIKKLNSVLPEHWSKRNPIDVGGDARPERYRKVMKIIGRKRFYDFLFFALTPQTMTNPEAVAKILIKFQKEKKIPCFSCFMGGKAVKKAKEILDAKILNFSEPEEGAKVIGKLIK